MTTRERIRAFITTNFYVTNVARLGDDASLLEAGVIDSTGVLEIVDFLERELGIRVGDTEIVPQNLGTIANITAYVDRKRGAESAG